MAEFVCVKEEANGFLGFQLGTMSENERNYNRIREAIDQLKAHGVNTRYEGYGLAGLCHIMTTYICGIRSLRDFSRLHYKLTGNSSIAYWRSGRKIIKSSFNYLGVEFFYCGEEKKAYLKDTFTVDYIVRRAS